MSEKDLKRTAKRIAFIDFLSCINHIEKQESQGGVVEVFTALMTRQSRVPTKLNGWKDVHRDWTEPYNDVSLQALTNLISRLEGSNAPGERFYARTITLVQSSGMGKSRLIAEFGKRYPCMNFCLRSGRRGYPPPDSDVLDSILAPKSKVIPHTQAKANETIE